MISPKFSKLAPPSSKTAKRVLFFYSIELTERTFKVKTQSIAESSETYPSCLEMSGKNINKEAGQPSFPAAKPEAPKPESSTARPRSTSHKKRKLFDPVELAITECSDYADLHKRLHTLGHLALEKMTKIHEALVKEAEDSKQMVIDLQRIGAAKNKNLAEATDELDKVKAELQDAYAQHAQDLEESHEQAKMLAAISIFQARVKMAEEAANKDFDQANWDVLGWKKLITELGGKPMPKVVEGKLVAEGEVEGSVKEAAEVIGQGDEGNKEKA
ncbi:hypothetical protein L1987_42360 [Smallanthus sonchifolius]|uniref:Uncharacterized protein n=1 Tax=Smallanthus sonchifolius TaxID=185202 RepID=A0ACB9GJD7_9ASTR|nr:hypothetical protein L1987_42360 [Smallanthus sonchifolius]